MAIQNEPTRISTPFADSGTKNVIPKTMAQPSATAAASWQAGFPTVCSLPLSAGGIPPARNDFNGLLNQMTQTERFLQDGGVFAWDASTDYGANRLVLGSDGLLYWSVAQSGPNVGGAQNPTTDSGVYWSTMPMMMPPLADNSSKAATTKWVRDLTVAPVYLDTAGSDSNDGMSAATAVKTFAKAMQIGSALPGSLYTVNVAPGTYTENVLVSDNNSCIFKLNGNVTINGDIEITKTSYTNIQGGYTLSVSGSIIVHGNSSLFISASSFVFSYSNSQNPGITCQSYSGIIVSSNVTATISNCPQFAYVQNDSDITFTGPVSVDATNVIDSVFKSEYASSMQIMNNVSVSGSGTPYCFSANTDSSIVFTAFSGSYTVSVADNAITTACVMAFNKSVVYFSDSFTQVSLSSSADTFFVGEKSLVCTSGNLTITSTGSTGNIINVSDGGQVALGGDSSTTQITVNATTASVFIRSARGSFVVINNNLSISGDFTEGVVTCYAMSYVGFSNNITITNNATGSRYYVGRVSYIDVGNSGDNRIPGSSPGYVDSASYGYYS